MKLEKVKVEVDLDLKISDESKKLLEWSFKYIGNDIDKVSDKVANLQKQMTLLSGDADTVRKGISGIFANHGIDFGWTEETDVAKIIQDLKGQVGGSVFSELTEAEVDALYEYMNKLMDVYDSASEKMQEVIDSFTDAIERANDEMNREFDKFDKFKDTLSYYKDIVN